MRNAFSRFLLLPLCTAGTLNLAAQAPPPGDSMVAPAPIKAGIPLPTRSKGFWHLGIAVGAVALLSVADAAVQEEAQSHRTGAGDDLAGSFKHFGEPVVYAPVALGTVAAGLLLGERSVTRAGGRIAGGLLMAGLATNLLKPLVGRGRPRFSGDAYDLDPFTRQDSWPSGHTAMAFALATSVSDEVGSLPVTIGLYGTATLTAWSRVNDDRH